ncbi:hypothetical protein KEM52_006189 [Ascosphaera acerosa]|nr:hypothetical protein KEM52_006189 [Ascosphaera acerosa]
MSPTGSSDAAPAKPKGILKRKSAQPLDGSTILAATAASSATSSAIREATNAVTGTATASLASGTPLPLTTANIKELTLQNTSRNAGKRRGSSLSRSAASATRRLSVPGGPAIAASTSSSAAGPSGRDVDADGHGAAQTSHLTWDEANLILHEQNKVPRMKIDEPKTPFAPHYVPDEDEEMMLDGEIPSLDIGDAEMGSAGPATSSPWQSHSLDSAHTSDAAPAMLRSPSPQRVGRSQVRTRDEHANGGPGSTSSRDRRLSCSSHGSEKHVGVDPKDASPAHDAEHEPQTEDEKRKHDMFEQKRKQHYEMSGIKGLLGKAIDLDEEDDDDEEDGDGDGSRLEGDVRDGAGDADEDDDDEDGDVDMNGDKPRGSSRRAPPAVPAIPEQFRNSK